MERVDVVVIGGGLAGLSAAWAAAAGGVRTIVVDKAPLPRSPQALIGLRHRDLEAVGLTPMMVERSHDLIAVDEHEPVHVDDSLAVFAVRGARVHQQLVTRARGASVEIRDCSEVIGVDSEDGDGWRVRTTTGEPIRAPVLLVADGARSPVLEAIGVAAAQRFSSTRAEVMTYVFASWGIAPEQADALRAIRVLGGDSPLGRFEVLPGRDSVTVAFGPVWRGLAKKDSSWPDSARAHSSAMLDSIQARLGLTTSPVSVEVEEWRIDALPTPPTFDGGIVIGAAAGHGSRSPLLRAGTVIHAARLAGLAAARSVLSKEWSAGSIGDRLGPDYDEVFAETRAEIEYQGRRVRRERIAPSELWRSPS